MASSPTDLQSQCDLLRLLHRPGAPLLLPNVWDVATAKAVVAAGFPVIATTSGGVAATLGYEDQEGAPAPAACTRSRCGSRVRCAASSRASTGR
jgi:2-methylisocitrate lyase-like PEP mutase family enzyme